MRKTEQAERWYGMNARLNAVWDRFIVEAAFEMKHYKKFESCPTQTQYMETISDVPRHNLNIDLRCATWIIPLVDPARRRKAVTETIRRIIELGNFDAIAFTGLSGSVVAGAVALTMDKYLYCVRKSEENRHSEYQVEGPATGLRYVIIDDFISSGSTICRIRELVSAHTDNTAVLVGVYLWRDDRLIVGNPTDKEIYG